MEEGAGKKRLFVAVPLPEAAHQALQQLQNQMKAYARDAKWVNPTGIHLTLKFLGNVDPERISLICGSLGTAAPHHSPVPLHIRGTGFFPNTRRPAVFWAGVESDGLPALQEDVESRMASLAFEKENRPFSPHLTLARFRDPHGLLPLTPEAEKWKDFSFHQFTADRFCLFESILHRTGAEYHVVQSFQLAGVP